MPELPEVEILVRHLDRALRGRTVRRVLVHRAKSTRPTSAAELESQLRDHRFVNVRRRAKYLVFTLRSPVPGRASRHLLGHLGMTGRMYVLPNGSPTPRHAAVELRLDDGRLVFEDTRYFGRLTLDTTLLLRLGPEPLEPGFTPQILHRALGGSSQAVKVKLLDQSALAGVGNIYACEALFQARLSPRTPCCRLTPPEVRRLHRAIQQVLRQAIAGGSTVPLDWAGTGKRDGLFYYGRAATAPPHYEERLRVYNRAGEPCPRCSTPIRRMEQMGRGTYYCPKCQRA